MSSKSEAAELMTILDTMAEGLFVIDSEHIIRRWNHAMERITGVPAAEALGQACAFLRKGGGPSSDDLAALECDIFAAGRVEQRELTITRKDGSYVPVLASARVIPRAEGQAERAVVTFTDISSLRTLETELNRLRREVTTRHEFHQLVGKSRPMQEVFGLIEMAAASPVTVLIQGETGTGKELVAKAIHYHSDRRDGPLVSVNCSALSESLLESELFGHARGAFTGAVNDHMGRFERADQGTLFLDEIAEISPAIQVKLLRVIQEKEFERVGDARPRRVDVRVITATHRDLRQRVQEGLFREDLFYRLKVFPIHLPPLRERKEDIDPLIRRFIERFNEQTGKVIRELTPDAMRIMLDYCWPGNVRELENAIEHAFVTCPGDVIGPFDLPIEIRRVELKRQLCDDEPPPRSPSPIHSGPVGKEELRTLLDACNWNKAEVARRLGITRTSVWRRMKRLGIPLDPPPTP